MQALIAFFPNVLREFKYVASLGILVLCFMQIAHNFSRHEKVILENHITLG